MRKLGHLIIAVEYDPEKADLEGISNALDQVMDTARDLIGDAFLPEEEWGETSIKSFRPLTAILEAAMNGAPRIADE